MLATIPGLFEGKRGQVGRIREEVVLELAATGVLFVCGFSSSSSSCVRITRALRLPANDIFLCSYAPSFLLSRSFLELRARIFVDVLVNTSS